MAKSGAALPRRIPDAIQARIQSVRYFSKTDRFLLLVLMAAISTGYFP
jgi:hypothetical protein